MLLLYEVVRDLEDKLKRLREENSALKDKNSVLKDEVERLKKVEKEFEEFKIKHLSVVGKLREALKIKPDKKGVNRGVRGAPKGHEGGGLVVPEVSVGGGAFFGELFLLWFKIGRWCF